MIPRRFIQSQARQFIRNSSKTPLVNAHRLLLPPIRTMSAAAHPVTSTANPAPPAEGLEPVTPKASDAAKAEAKHQKKEAKKEKKGGSSGPLELNPPPEFFQERIKIFDEYKAKYDKWVAGARFWSSGAILPS